MTNKFKFLAFMLLSMMLSVNQVWGAGDETLTISGASTGHNAPWGTSYGSGSGTSTTSASTSIGISYTNVARLSTAIQIKASTSNEFHSTTCPTGKVIKSITITYKTNSSNLYVSTDGSNWTTAEEISSTTTKNYTTSQAYKYFKVGATSSYTQITSIVVTYQETSSYTIAATVNEASYGSVEVSGTTITAKPNTGYCVDTSNPYKVTSGTADVTYNGDNTFSVTPSSNCSIQVNLKAKSQYTVTFYNNSTQVKSVQVYEGDKIGSSNMPTVLTAWHATSNEFAGWTTQVIKGNTQTTIDGEQVVDQYTVVSGNMTVYALWGTTDATTSTFDASNTDNLTESEDYYEFSEKTTGVILGGGEIFSDAGNYFRAKKDKGDDVYIYVQSANKVIKQVVFTIDGTVSSYGLKEVSNGSLSSTSSSPQTVSNVRTNFMSADPNGSTIDLSKVVVTTYTNYISKSITYTDYLTECETTYSITYVCNGATSGCPDPTTVSGQTALPNPLPTVAKTGNNFGGWFTDSKFQTAAVAGASISENTTLYAKWIPLYTVTYAAGEGSGTMTDSDSPYQAGVTVTLLSNSFTAPDGKKWSSWVVKDADDNTISVTDGQFTMPSSNVTVTAQWEVTNNFKNNETIFFRSQNSSGDQDHSAWWYGACVKAWFHTTGSTAVNTAWLNNGSNYKMYYAVVPASGDYSELQLQRFASNCTDWWGSAGDLTQAGRNGKNTIASWSTDNDTKFGAAWHNDIYSLKVRGSIDSWAADQISLSDAGAGVFTGSLVGHKVTVNTSEEFRVRDSEGVYFGTDGASHDNTTLSDMKVGSTYTINASFDLASRVLTITKTLTAATISFDLQGHGMAIAPLADQPAGQTITAPTAPTATGYTFGGWYKEAACTNAWNFASDVVTESITLYAKWTANTINITLNGNTGTAGTATVKYNATELSSINHATKTNYDRTGYYTAASGGTKVLNADGTFAATAVTDYIVDGKWSKATDCTLYAQWTGVNCNVYFHDNNDSPTATVIPFGTSYTLPTISGGCSGYTAEGWTTTAPTTHAWATKPATTAAGTDVTIDATEKHFYAVFSQGVGNPDAFVKVNSSAEFESGATYMYVWDKGNEGTLYGMSNSFDTDHFNPTSELTVVDSKVINNEKGNRWIITSQGGGYYSIQNVDNNKYIGTDNSVIYRSDSEVHPWQPTWDGSKIIFYCPSCDMEWSGYVFKSYLQGWNNYDGDMFFGLQSDYDYGTCSLYKQDGSKNYISNPDCRTVTGIAVKTEPKTDYTEGQTFDPTGLVITVTYSEGAPADVEYDGHEGSFTFVPSTSTPLTTSHESVQITYGGQSTSLTINVTALPRSTVTFKNNGTTVGDVREVITGSTIGTLPVPTDFSPTLTSCDGTSTTFVGWTEATVSKKTDTRPTIITAAEVINSDKVYNAVWATGTGLTSYTMKYESSSTTNMTGGNDAATVNLDKDVWSVIGSKGGHENYPGLSKNGYIVLYYGSTTKINEMTVSSLTSTPIYNIVVNYTSDQYNGGRVYVNSSLVTPTDSTYSIGATSFTMKSSGSGSTASQVRFSSLVINTGTPATGYITHCLTPCETPTFSPVAGDYEGAQNVTISTTTAGATIYYTTDGTTPTTSSTKYTDAVNVGAGTTTINAIAVKDGMADSEVASATYNIVTVVANPVISGTDCFESSSEVTITCTTAGATIYYTLDGSDPTSSSTLYNGAFTIDATKTVKAIATKSGLTSSSVVSETFTKKALTGITVGTAPTKDTYKEGQFFDPTGLVLTLSYNCGTDGSVSYAGHEGDFTFTPSLSTPLTTSHTSVTIEYGGLSTTQDITVNPLVLYTVHLFREGVEITSVTQTEEGGNVTLPTDWGTCSDYTFCGWSKTDNVTSAPTVTGETYQPTANTNLYAVYSQGMGEAWTLVNNVSDLEAGAYKIVATSYNYAMGTISGNNAPGAAIVKSGNVLSTVAGADYTLTESWQEGSTNWYIYNTAGKYLAAGSSSGATIALLDYPCEYNESTYGYDDNLNAAWAISFSGNSANIVAQGSYTYNKIQYNNNSTVFSCYASGQKAVSLYKYVASAQTYTTRPGCPVCDLTISKGSETSSQGTYTVTNTGSNKCPGISSVVTAVPADGYAFTGVTCSPTTGSVGAIVDNVCTVSNITASTTITAVFTPIIYHNITWKVNDVDYTTGTPTSSWLEGMSLSTIKLPTAPANNTLQTACGSVARKFMGWSTSDVGWQTGSSAPAVLFTSAAQAGTQVGSMGSSDMIFYAVFAEEVVESTTWSEFVADGGMTSCDFVIAAIYDNKYYGLDNTYATTSADKVAGVDITSHVSQGTISAANAAGYKFTFTKTTYSTTSCYNIKGATCYYGAPASANFIAKSSVDGGSYYWTVGAGSHGTYNILNVQESGRSILFNGSPNYKYGAYSGSGSYYGAEILAIAVGEPTYQNYMTKCCPTPAAPTSLNATPAVDGGTVYWTKSANATAYEVQVNGGEWTNVGDVNNYTISGLACGGTAVNWKVRALNYCYTSTEANHAFYTAQCNCDGFQFHYRDFSGNWNTNNVCFSAVAGTDHDQLTEEFALPYANAFNVSWQGSPLSDSKTKTTDFQYMGYFLQNSKNFGVNPQNGNMGGALGKMHIYDNSGSDNMYVQWIPTGYTLQMGDGSNWPTTYNFTGKTNAWYETEWLTDLVTVTDAQIGGKIYVGLKTTNGYVWCGTYSEVIDLNGLRTKAGADDSWVSGGLSTAYANKTGKFRIYANSGDKNWYVTFVPHLQLTYNANGGSGEMAGSDWRSVELDDEGRTVTVAANGFTAPDGKAFKGWNTNAAGTGDWINVANDWVLRENISNVLYAIWDQKYPVRYTGSTSGEIDHYEVAGATVDIKDDPVEVGYTFNGWTVTDDHANNIAVNGSSNNYYFTMPADGVTVHANMTANVTNLNYYDMGGADYSGTNRPSLPDTHTYGSPTILPAGVKAGYEFGGWHLESDCSDAAIAELSASVVYGSSLSIYTKWTKASTVTFIDHSDIVSSSEVAEGSEIPFPVSPDCELYTFLGWAETGVIAETTTDPGLTYYKQGDHVAMGSEAKTFRAVYSKLEGEAGYRYDKITSGVTNGNYVLIDQTATTSGYTYSYFNSDHVEVVSITLPENCTTIDESALPNNTEILKIEVNGSNFSIYESYGSKYIIGANSNGLSSTTTKTYDWKLTTGGQVSSKDCPVGAINSVNYSTRVWQYVSTSGGRFAGYENTQKNWVYLFKQVEKGTRYYATEPECIAPTQIMVTYDANGQAGTTLPANTALDYNPYPNFNTYNVGHATDVTGWHFSKWNTQSNGLGTDYAADAEVTTFGGGDAITLYAQWETVYTVTKHDNGATTPIVQTGAGAAIDLGTGASAGHCDKEGGFDWTFVGWTTSSTPLAEYPVCPTLIANPSAYVPAENVDVYAVYSRPITNTTAFSSGVSGAYKVTNIAGDKYLGATTGSSGNYYFSATADAAQAQVIYVVYKDNKYSLATNQGFIEHNDGTSVTFTNTANGHWDISSSGDNWMFKMPSTYAHGSDRWLSYASDRFNMQQSGYKTAIALTPTTATYYYSNPVCQDGYNITFTQVGGTVNYGGGSAEDYQGLTGGTTVTTFPTIDLRGDLMDWAFVGWSTTDYNTQHAGSLDDEGASIDVPAGAIYRTDGPNTFTMPNTNVTLYPVFTSMKANEPLDLEDGGDYYVYFTSDNQAGFRDPYYAIDGHTIRVYAQQVSGNEVGNEFSSTQHCANAQKFHFEQRETGKWNIRLRNSAGDGYISNSYLTNPYSNDNRFASQPAEPEGYWTIEQQPNGSFKAQYSVNAGTHYFMKGLVSNPSIQASATFKCYSQDCDNSNQFYAVYLGSCEERTFSSNPNPQPDLRIEGVVNITSRKGDNIAVRGAQTLTLQGIRLTEGETITITSNNADVYFSTTTAPNFTKANKPMTSVDVTVPADGNVNMPIYVHYKPSTNVDGIETVNVTVSASVHTLLTSEVKIHCRHLPDQFVIAAKVGTQWYALPANMTAADNPLATPITVNEATMMAEAPTNCAYMMWPVKTTSTTGDRYEAAGEAVRFAAVKDSAALWASDAAGTHTTINNSAKIKTIGSDVKNPNYEWAISTSDLKVYTLTATGDNNTANLVINRPTSGGKKGQLVWGTYGTSETSQLYLLPFTTFTDMQATVVEWFRDKVLVELADGDLWTAMQTAGTTSNSRIGDGDWSADAAVDYTTYGTKLCVFNTGNLLNQAGNQLSVKVTVSETDYQTNVEVPIIVSYTNKSVTDAPFSTLTAAKYNNMDLVIRDGAHLNANGADKAANTFRNVTIYPTSKLRIDEGKEFQANGQITLRGGKDEIYDGSKYEMTVYGGEPQLYALGLLHHPSTPIIYYEKRVDTKRMYQLSLPDNVPLADVTYGDGTPMAINTQLWAETWDGQAAANEDASEHWILEKDFDPAQFTMGVGYTVSCKRQVKGQKFSIMRFPMDKHVSGDAEVPFNEYVYVTLWQKQSGTGRLNSYGWNYIGNPYMTAVKGNIYIQDPLDEETLTELPYLTYMSPDGSMYYSDLTQNVEMLPFRSFFAQVTCNGRLVISNTARKADAPARKQTLEDLVMFYLYLQQGDQNDFAGMRISENYSEEYVIGQDLEKQSIGPNTSVYYIDKDGNLAFDAVKPAHATNWIPVGFYAPNKGSMTFSLDVKEGTMNLKHVYLQDVVTKTQTDLLTDDYVFTTDQTGKIDNRFYIAVEFTQEVPTGIDDVEGTRAPFKFINEDKLFIEYKGVIYDANGKRVNL